ncbi:hypothetical protein B0H16DRAFT_1475303 [Mycena metata]|uniref:Uncharacterized protein n=1 Tax=Mycena metata TaxID=1033252 RepID=A0AAD7MJ72_9AGAR|nr:hypothetical protein B0H16DRAFT_1475303 [Mycena metata]
MTQLTEGGVATCERHIEAAVWAVTVHGTYEKRQLVGLQKEKERWDQILHSPGPGRERAAIAVLAETLMYTFGILRRTPGWPIRRAFSLYWTPVIISGLPHNKAPRPIANNFSIDRSVESRLRSSDAGPEPEVDAGTAAVSRCSFPSLQSRQALDRHCDHVPENQHTRLFRAVHPPLDLRVVVADIDEIANRQSASRTPPIPSSPPTALDLRVAVADLDELQDRYHRRSRLRAPCTVGPPERRDISPRIATTTMPFRSRLPRTFAGQSPRSTRPSISATDPSTFVHPRLRRGAETGALPIPSPSSPSPPAKLKMGLTTVTFAVSRCSGRSPSPLRSLARTTPDGRVYLLDMYGRESFITRIMLPLFFFPNPLNGLPEVLRPTTMHSPPLPPPVCCSRRSGMKSPTRSLLTFMARTAEWVRQPQGMRKETVEKDEYFDKL